jgi:hypothetical protein
MPRSALAAVVFFFAAVSLEAASRSRIEQAKIRALLSEMQGSDAAFIRNGKEYTGKKSASHLKRKLAFAGSRVVTARDFVRGIATRSEESGEPYRVRFRNGQTRLLREWLEERLAVLEKP